MTGVKDAISAMDRNVCGLKDQITLLTKEQRLHFAMTHRSANSFDYSISHSHNNASEKLVGTILLAFHQGKGCFIPKHAKVQNSAETFTNLLVTQIHELTGIKPRLGQHDGEWAIYYS